MSVLIKGLTMPKNSYEVKTIAIRPDGTWYEMTIRGDYDYESGEAVEVPTPHGRLVDVDASTSKFNGIPIIDEHAKVIFKHCDTVIEAED